MLVSLLLIASAIAGTYRRLHPRGWTRTELVVDPNQKVSFRLALPQKNLDVLAAETIERATPTSSKYAQWFKPAEVLDLIAPEQEVVDTVVSWARSAGLKADGSRRDQVVVEGTVKAVEEALNTKLFYYQHDTSATRHLRTIEWTLPDEIYQHVEVLGGLTEFWPKPKGPVVAAAGNLGKKRNSVSAGYIIPDVVRDLYAMPKDSYRKTSIGSSICVAEFQSDPGYSHSDLTLFDQQTGEDRAHVNHIVGPFMNQNPDAESSLDIQYASTLSLNSSYWFYVVSGWMMEFSNDLFTSPGPLVVSMSWGWPEDQQCAIASSCNGITSHQYVTRVDAEWLKITSTGVTLLAASGDQGAPGDNHGSACDGISDIYPGASPWITSVGATMLATGGSAPVTTGPPACGSNPPGCATATEETTCSINEALITSGGGFARYEAMPKWQTTVVNDYLNNAPNLPPSGTYNPANRAFPDVSAIGHAVLIGYTGQLLQVDGTSCSSPIVASIVALLNGWRINNKKTPLGFINPLLYTAYAKNAAIFNDITTGNNDCSENCCGTMGYTAISGWDAATGLGTINFAALLAYVQTL